MQEEMCIVSEVWLAAGPVDHFRHHMARVTELLQQHGAECAYFGHPFEWVSDATEGELPTGIQVLRFDSEARARAALALLNDPELRAESQQVFRKTRTYLSRPTARPELVDWLPPSRERLAELLGSCGQSSAPSAERRKASAPGAASPRRS